MTFQQESLAIIHQKVKCYIKTRYSFIFFCIGDPDTIAVVIQKIISVMVSDE
jgi:hypothetical protein